MLTIQILRLLIKKRSPKNFGFKTKHSLEFSFKGRLFTTPDSRGYFFSYRYWYFAAKQRQRGAKRFILKVRKNGQQKKCNLRAAPNQPNRPVQHRENQTRTATNASVTLQKVTTGYCAVWNVKRLHPLTPQGLWGGDMWYFRLEYCVHFNSKEE